MSLDAFELTEQDSEPVEVYQFRLGNNQGAWNYTSAATNITVGAISYTSVHIDRDAVSASSEDRRNALTVRVLASDPVAAGFIAVPPDQKMTLTILRVQRKDGAQETDLIYKGVVNSVGFERQGLIAAFYIKAISSGLDKSVPRFAYQGLCNHVLYDGQCKVDKQLFKYEGNVLSIIDNTITVQGISGNGPDWAVGGYVQTGAAPGTGFRMVLAQAGDTLTILLPFQNTPVGQTVTVFAGCDHALSTCDAKFDNVDNYGGFPFVPSLNPFSVGLDV